MSDITERFEITISRDKMKASIVSRSDFDGKDPITLEELQAFVKENGVIFGVHTKVLEEIVESGDVPIPTEIAVGRKPVSGKDAELRPLQFELKKTDLDDRSNVDLKKVIDIPSVQAGDLVGEKIPATPGEPGMNVLGEEVPAKPGKDFVLRPGKNTRVEDGLKIYAMLNGQLCAERRIIHVYPVFEVNGDLDLKVGNISFVGNVTIRGNVPSGFEIDAKGDIRIHGTVEAAKLTSEGSIFVSAGIVGQGGGVIYAKQDLHATYINQAKVQVEGDVNVVQSILHSDVTAGRNIICTRGKGNIVGGNVSAGQAIIAKEIGNSMHTATALFIGVHQNMLIKEKELMEQIEKSTEEIMKLKKLANIYETKEKSGTELQANERIMKLRIRNSMVTFAQQLTNAKEELEELQQMIGQKEYGMVKVEQKLYPNTSITFGKYRKVITSVHEHMQFSLVNSEIQMLSM